MCDTIRPKPPVQGREPSSQGSWLHLYPPARCQARGSRIVWTILAFLLLPEWARPDYHFLKLHICFVITKNNQIGGAARLAAPSSYRSTSAFEAIRANLAIPLGMALKMRSKWGCEASNLLCSAIRNNVTIEGTWIFGGWRLCP